MPLASFDLFALVIARFPTCLGRLDALGIDDRRRWTRVASGSDPHLVTQRVVDALPCPVITPDAEIVIDRLPVREVVRECAPLDAVAHDIDDGIDDLVYVVRNGVEWRAL